MPTVDAHCTHSALSRRACESERTAKTHADAADWLQRESAYLRKVSRLLGTAAGRVETVLDRCSGQASAP
jgi:hypothetical protein